MELLDNYPRAVGCAETQAALAEIHVFQFGIARAPNHKLTSANDAPSVRDAWGRKNGLGRSSLAEKRLD